MDWMRSNGGIGMDCVDQDEHGVGDHLPEHWQEEQEEYLEYICRSDVLARTFLGASAEACRPGDNKLTSTC